MALFGKFLFGAERFGTCPSAPSVSSPSFTSFPGTITAPDSIGQIFQARGRASTSIGHTHNFVELFGGRTVLLTPHEPDPNTFREGFYYNSREDRLKKKIQVGNQFVWKPVNND